MRKILTQEKVNLMKAMWENGVKVVVIGKTLGISPITISRLKSSNWDLEAYRKKGSEANEASRARKKVKLQKQLEEGKVTVNTTPLKELEKEKEDVTDSHRWMLLNQHLIKIEAALQGLYDLEKEKLEFARQKAAERQEAYSTGRGLRFWQR